jgi:glycosyltransferase involved in cell wall biosynthesis
MNDNVVPQGGSLSPPLSFEAMRILQVAPSYAPVIGGDAHLLRAVSERLVQRGHDVTVLTFDARSYRDFRASRGAGLAPREFVNGVRVIRVGPDTRLTRALHRVKRLPGGWRALSLAMGHELWPLTAPSGLSMLPSIARLEADVVTTMNWAKASAFWTCPPRWLRRAPRVAIPILHIQQAWADNPLFPRMLRACDAAIVCTDAERDFIEARGARAVAVAGVGVDLDRFARADGASLRSRYGLGGRPVVGFVGRQEKEKGVSTLIESMRRVRGTLPDAVLLLAGQSAHRTSAVTQELAALPQNERANTLLIDDFADEDGPSIIDACDVLALPSVEESFGMVMVEAWACGKPVIGADIPSTRCIIESGGDGFIVPPYDTVALADRLLDLLVSPSMRRHFGARGRAKVAARYTWDRVTDVWEKTLRGAAARAHDARIETGVDI